MEGMGSHREVRGDVEARVVGPAPLIGAVCDQIGLVEVVDSMTRWDRRQCKLSPGQRIKALVLNILSGRRPLYKVANFFKDTDVELLLGKGVGAEDLGDVALGRALDKLVKAGPKAIYSAVAARAVLLEQVDTTFVHWDSTSRSVYGEYADTNGTLELVHGYSKDHRPDLRQFLMALLCNREGIPVWAKIQNGNTSDKRGNQEAIDELLATLTPERLRETVYVADAALLTTANLRIMDQAGLRFISRLPETFAACTQAKRAAFAAGRWEDLGVLAQNPRPTSASYRVSEQTGMIDGRTYRLVVVHSNQLDAGKEKRLQKDVADERVELTRELNALAQEEFACEADARKAAAAWLKTHAQTWHPVTFTFSARMVTDRRPRRGRPRKDELAPTRTVYHAAGQLGAPDPERLQAERERRSCFVLITDLKDAHRYDARRLLREYRDQVAVETRFRFLKNPIWVDAMFVHRRDRFEALAYVLVIACLVYTIIERRARRTLRASGEILHILGKRKTSQPTAQSLLEMFTNLTVGRPPHPSSPTRLLLSPAHMWDRAHSVLRIIGVSLDVYRSLPQLPSGP